MSSISSPTLELAHLVLKSLDPLLERVDVLAQARLQTLDGPLCS